MSAESKEPELIWEALMDDRYRVSVTRIDGSTGRLTVCDQSEQAVLHTEEVFLLAGARFGPDVSDVACWQEKAIAVVDNPK